MPFQLAACNNFRCVIVSLPIGLPSDSIRSSVRFISYRNDRYWEKKLSQVLYTQRWPLTGFWTVLFLVSDYRWISFIETYVPRITFHTLNLFTMQILQDVAGWCKLSSPTTWAVSIHSHEMIINGQPTLRNCTDKALPVLGTLQYCVLSCVVLYKSKRLLYCVSEKKKITIQHFRISNVKFEHFLSCFVGVTYQKMCKSSQRHTGVSSYGKAK